MLYGGHVLPTEKQETILSKSFDIQYNLKIGRCKTKHFISIRNKIRVFSVLLFHYSHFCLQQEDRKLTINNTRKLLQETTSKLFEVEASAEKKFQTLQNAYQSLEKQKHDLEVSITNTIITIYSWDII